ncbi:MAG: hypothetical protein ABW133_06365 [Polyangiaceae bacterium]
MGWATIGCAMGTTACSRRISAPEHDEQTIAAEHLRAFDAERRNVADFGHLPTWDRVSGPDPYAVVRISASRLAGILRGDDAIVVLDEAMHELARAAAPASPVAITKGDDGALFVAGEFASALDRFVWRDEKLEPAGRWDLGEIRAVRGLAAGAGDWIYVAEEAESRLLALRLEPRVAVAHRFAATSAAAAHAAATSTVTPHSAAPHSAGFPSPAPGRIVESREIAACRGPVRLLRVADRLIANCLLDHRLLVHRLDASGAPRVEPPVVMQHDGPIWGFDARATSTGLLIAAGGVEDHPLDRTIGAFGYIDSFLDLYRIDAVGAVVHREASINLSERGVVTPKAIALQTEPLAVTVAGYGSDRLLTLSFPAGTGAPPAIDARPFLPGANAVEALEGGLVFANPLLDAWVVARPGAAPVVVSAPGIVSASSPGPPIAASRAAHLDAGTAVAANEPKLGEALFFTTLMAPFNTSDGALSRFTCETCHFEGYVDGRTHHTGRDDVHAVTKPLLGLFNNRPHFSRALDPDLTAVAFNEFRVAGAKSGHDPWFSISSREAPWLEQIGYNGANLSPETLRRALMAFLIAFQHRPNPAVIGRTHFTDEERRGAELFRDRCETCHEARLASDQPATRVAFERWESLVMAREGPLVWGKDVYAQTGIVPYVHEKGARIPSLRRLYKKHPYFTNGSADSLDDVLARARFLPSGFAHDVPSPAAESSNAREPDKNAVAENQLDDLSRRALLGFLKLL